MSQVRLVSRNYSPGAANFLKPDLTSTKVLVAAGQLTLYDAQIVNIGSAAATTLVNFYDAAATADVTVGTTVPVISLVANTGLNSSNFPIGRLFKLGLVLATPGNSTAGISVNLGYAHDPVLS